MTETVIVALISAIGGSLIKPLFDYLTLRDSSKDERDTAAYERAIKELERKDEDLKEFKQEISEAEGKIDEWREKYWTLFVQTNTPNSDPEQLKAMLKEIIGRED